MNNLVVVGRRVKLQTVPLMASGYLVCLCVISFKMIYTIATIFNICGIGITQGLYTVRSLSPPLGNIQPDTHCDMLLEIIIMIEL